MNSHKHVTPDHPIRSLIARAHPAIPAELSIRCGVGVGYPDPDFSADNLHVGREPLAKNVVFPDNY